MLPRPQLLYLLAPSLSSLPHTSLSALQLLSTYTTPGPAGVRRVDFSSVDLQLVDSLELNFEG